MSRPLTIRIGDAGGEFTLTYEGLLAYHGGGAVAGASVGFRVMQAAAETLAPNRAWERSHVAVLSGHPGPGYCDAFEYVTRCVTRDWFRVDRGLPGGRHSPYQDYAFQFVVDDTNAGRRATVTVREGIIPLRLFELLRERKRLSADRVVERELSSLKEEIAQRVVAMSIAELFAIQTAPLGVGR